MQASQGLRMTLHAAVHARLLGRFRSLSAPVSIGDPRQEKAKKRNVIKKTLRAGAQLAGRFRCYRKENIKIGDIETGNDGATTPLS